MRMYGLIYKLIIIIIQLLSVVYCLFTIYDYSMETITRLKFIYFRTIASQGH